MLDFRPVFLVVGILLTTLAVGMIIPAAVDAVAGNPEWQVFGVSAGVTMVVGAALANDGAEAPQPCGTASPVVQTAADLPAQPELPAELGLVAAVVNPPGLHVYTRGQWRAL